MKWGHNGYYYKILTLCTHYITVGASEVEVFQGCVRWLDRQCAMQEVELTPQNRREMLGEALYLLHLPSLSLRHFTDVVLPTQLLNSGEENAIFRYIGHIAIILCSCDHLTHLNIKVMW